MTCKTDGNPPPVIEWFKDGDKLRVTDNRIILPNGSLYFLHVVDNTFESDEGTYHCIAKNEAGRAKSGSASLILAGQSFFLVTFFFSAISFKKSHFILSQRPNVDD